MQQITYTCLNATHDRTSLQLTRQPAANWTNQAQLGGNVWTNLSFLSLVLYISLLAAPADVSSLDLLTYTLDG